MPVSCCCLRAQTRGPFHLTMNTNDAIETGHAFPDAVIVPVHYEGWAHFTQSGGDLDQAFRTLSFGSRRLMLEAGVARSIELELDVSTAELAQPSSGV